MGTDKVDSIDFLRKQSVAVAQLTMSFVRRLGFLEIDSLEVKISCVFCFPRLPTIIGIDSDGCGVVVLNAKGRSRMEL